jgi:MoxR-like ATPase
MFTPKTLEFLAFNRFQNSREWFLEHKNEYVQHVQNPLIELGVSPRGSLAMMNMVKATAFLSGRDYVVPGDVQYIFKDVAAHRMILKAKARVNNVTVDNLLDDILRIVRPPKIIAKNAL